MDAPTSARKHATCSTLPPRKGRAGKPTCSCSQGGHLQIGPETAWFHSFAHTHWCRNSACCQQLFLQSSLRLSSNQALTRTASYACTRRNSQPWMASTRPSLETPMPAISGKRGSSLVIKAWIAACNTQHDHSSVGWGHDYGVVVGMGANVGKGQQAVKTILSILLLLLGNLKRMWAYTEAKACNVFNGPIPAVQYAATCSMSNIIKISLSPHTCTPASAVQSVNQSSAKHRMYVSRK